MPQLPHGGQYPGWAPSWIVDPSEWTTSAWFPLVSARGSPYGRSFKGLQVHPNVRRPGLQNCPTRTAAGNVRDHGSLRDPITSWDDVTAQ